MKNIAFAVALVFIVLGFCQETTARKPRMTPAEQEIVVQDGEELKIQCKGEGKLHFSTQMYAANINGSEYNISVNEDSGTYTFIRSTTIREDTGWYACAPEGVEIENYEQIINHKNNDIAWIYVYVNSSVPFVVDAAFDLLTVVAGGTLVVPCRTTSPDLPVKLEINWGLTDVPADTKYDPKIGFILNNVGKVLSAQTFECQVDGSESEPVSYTLHVIDSEPLEIPVINHDRIRHVVWGRDLNVDCEITVATDQKFSMYWKVPESVPKERWGYSRDRIVVSHVADNQSESWRTVLTVRNVQKTDEGEYICIAERPHDRVQQRAVINKIWDPTYSYVNVTVQGSTEVKSHERETAMWMLIIDTYPENITLAWYKPDGQKIFTSEPDKHSKYSHISEGIHHYFKISQLNVEDNGNYTVNVSNDNVEKIISLQLTVRAAPFVHVDKVLPFYEPGQTATFTCQTSGLPLPNVTWIIREYPDFISKENPEIKYPSNFTNKPGQRDAYQLVSTLDAIVNQTGYVICKSCNEINCSESTGHVVVSDVNGHFGIIDPGLVTEGDDINLNCGASVYNFTSSITWRLSNDQKYQEFNTSRIRLTTRITNFTSQSILEIRNVKKSDGRKYICEALTKEGFTESTEYELVVHDAVAPRFENSTTENSEISIDLRDPEEHSMVKECFAVGMPIPQVTWYKNDQLLVEGNQYKYSENNRRLQISYFLDGDSGRYKCKATNRIGTAEKYTDIVIIGKLQRSNTLLIGLISSFIAIVTIVITYMGIRLRQEKHLRKELLDAVSVKYQEGAVRCWSVDDRADLVPSELSSDANAQDQSNYVK